MSVSVLRVAVHAVTVLASLVVPRVSLSVFLIIDWIRLDLVTTEQNDFNSN